MISYEKFLSWAESRFDGDVVISGKEIKLNSPFAEDRKHHMWCNPTGGKKGEEDRPYGVYHCWKTDKKGTLVGLVMSVDQCDFETACEVLEVGNVSMALLEEKLEDLFGNKEKVNTVEIVKTNGLQLPPHTHKITSLDKNNFFRIEAELQLESRNMPVDKFYVCIAGDYKNRIVIPYYDRKGTLFYFNSRYMGENKNIAKYLGPPKEVGIGKENVVYMVAWPEKGSEVCFCEGEFDAEALTISGFNGGAFGGKNMSEEQIVMIKDYLPILCFDNDKAGENAIYNVGKFILSHGINNVRYVRPPVGLKDWNQMLTKYGPITVKKYMLSRIKSFNDTSGDEKILRTI